MGRRLIQTLTVASLIVLIGTSVLWARSFWAAQTCLEYAQRQWTADYHYVSTFRAVAVRNGQVDIEWVGLRWNMDKFRPDQWATLTEEARQGLGKFRAQYPDFAGWELWSCDVSHSDWSDLSRRLLGRFERGALPPYTGYRVAVPIWLVAALAALLPLRWAERRWRRPTTPPLAYPALAAANH